MHVIILLIALVLGFYLLRFMLWMVVELLTNSVFWLILCIGGMIAAVLFGVMNPAFAYANGLTINWIEVGWAWFGGFVSVWAAAIISMHGKATDYKDWRDI